MSGILPASFAFALAAALATVQVGRGIGRFRTGRRIRDNASGTGRSRSSSARRVVRLPHPFTARARRRRDESISSQLAPALDLVIGHLRIGRNVVAAMTDVSDSLTDPLRSVVVEALEESRLGESFGDSLQRIADREGNRHLGVVASAIGLQARHGGSLIDVLETVHATIEEEDRLRRDIRTLTADNRLSARILLALPPVMLIVVSLLDPGYAAPLVTDPLGRRMTVAGALLAFVGWRWLRRLGDPNVVA